MAATYQTIQKIMQMLMDAAACRGTVSFDDLYSVQAMTRAESHAALEQAANDICGHRRVNYTALMANPSDGLPGSGFFDMFRLHRRSDYVALVGDCRLVQELTQEQLRKLTDAERQRVYADAGA